MASMSPMSNAVETLSPATLGDVLYANSSPPVSEQAWLGLVRSISAGDQQALQALFEMAHRIVFTLIMRMTSNAQTAEELTIDVFHDIWRRAAHYDPENGTVIGWIMNQARSRAIDRLRFDGRRKRNGELDEATENPVADPRDVLEHLARAEALRAALTTLTPGERTAIETSFFGGLTHAETAARLGEPLGTVKTRIRAGLQKLKNALAAQGVST
jgi:RNA polymerase sigma-70 factor (ECF subfamily)